MPGGLTSKLLFYGDDDGDDDDGDYDNDGDDSDDGVLVANVCQVVLHQRKSCSFLEILSFVQLSVNIYRIQMKSSTNKCVTKTPFIRGLWNFES